jgi:hypothetical protein
MSGSDRSTDRIVRAWLEGGVTQLPDRLLDGVLDQLPATRQRQPFRLARRFSHMSSSLRYSLAAAAAVVVIGGGAYLFAGGNVGAPASTASPTPTEIATPTPTPDHPADLLPEADVPLEPGTYFVSQELGAGVARVIMTVPDGWTSHESWYVYREPILSAGNGVSFGPQQPIKLVHPDPCTSTSVVVGDSVDDLVTALIDTPMHDGVDPIDIGVSGYAGKEVHISSDAAIDVETCSGAHVSPWFGRWVLPGTEQTLWILDVEGNRLVIDATAEPGADATQRAELRQVLESIQIEFS